MMNKGHRLGQFKDPVPYSTTAAHLWKSTSVPARYDDRAHSCIRICMSQSRLIMAENGPDRQMGFVIDSFKLPERVLTSPSILLGFLDALWRCGALRLLCKFQ